MSVQASANPSEIALAVAGGAATSRWLSVVSHLHPRYGGLSAVVPQLAARLSAEGQRMVAVEAFCLPDEQYRPPAYPDLPIDYYPTSRKAWLLDRSLSRRLRTAVADADGVHIHGLWDQSSLVAGRAARATGKPYVVSAHGMLEPWALARSRAKKQVYAAFFERANLAGAACLHALTKAEARNYRAFGCRQPIAVIPNAVEVPPDLSPKLFLDAFPVARGKRLMLFLGRLHQKKGVVMLARAWARTLARYSNACLVLAGPSEDSTRTEVEQFLRESGMGEQVLLPGLLAPAIKWSALAAAEAFVLPSYSEGLSMAVLEALGAGRPVIVTENCNLPEAAAAGAGWQIRADESSVAEALLAWYGNLPETNAAMGLRGRTLVAERYSWATVAGKMAELYSWVEGGPMPRSFAVETAEVPA